MAYLPVIQTYTVCMSLFSIPEAYGEKLSLERGVTLRHPPRVGSPDVAGLILLLVDGVDDVLLQAGEVVHVGLGLGVGGTDYVDLVVLDHGATDVDVDDVVGVVDSESETKQGKKGKLS